MCNSRKLQSAHRVRSSTRRHGAALVVTGVLLLAGCRATPPAVSTAVGHQPCEESAILGVLDDYLRALSANDLTTMARLQTSDGMTYVAGPASNGKVGIMARPNSFWVDPANADGAGRERYWSPSVSIRGPIAVVWAPYEFWTGDKTSHCGVDVFNLVKVEQRWLIASSMWTVEPNGCDGLRPADSGSLRPPG